MVFGNFPKCTKFMPYNKTSGRFIIIFSIMLPLDNHLLAFDILSKLPRVRHTMMAVPTFSLDSTFTASP